MRIRELRRNSRESFTLIELLTVISIITILAALLLAAVMKALYKRPEVTATTEMHQMDGALQQFQQKTGAPWIPSQLHVCQNMKNYGNSQLDQDSLFFITNYIGKNSNTFKAKWSTTGIQWASGMSA